MPDDNRLVEVALTREVLNEIFDIIQQECGVDEGYRRAFLTLRSQTLEFGFESALGSGGKFWNNRGWYVTTYPEEMTPARRAAIDSANRRLSGLRDRYERPILERLAPEPWTLARLMKAAGAGWGRIRSQRRDRLG